MNIHHHFGGGVYAKETRVKAGQILVQHKHEFDHLSVLASGVVELLVEGVRSELTGPACVVIAANKHHGIKAMTDVVWFCIHATDCIDEDKIDEVLIVDGSQQEMNEIVGALQ